MDDQLADLFDKLMKRRATPVGRRRSAICYAARSGAAGWKRARHRSGVGTLSYVFNHHERQLASRLAAMHHEHHDVTVSAMHAHLDHDNCLETVILRGPTQTVLQFAESVIAEKGVRHGKISVIPVDSDAHSHSHGPGRGHKHTHARPRTQQDGVKLGQAPYLQCRTKVRDARLEFQFGIDALVAGIHIASNPWIHYLLAKGSGMATQIKKIATLNPGSCRCEPARAPRTNNKDNEGK